MVFIFLAGTKAKEKREEQPLADDQKQLLDRLNSSRDILPKPLYDELKGRIYALGKTDDKSESYAAQRRSFGIFMNDFFDWVKEGKEDATRLGARLEYNPARSEATTLKWFGSVEIAVPREEEKERQEYNLLQALSILVNSFFESTRLLLSKAKDAGGPALIQLNVSQEYKENDPKDKINPQLKKWQDALVDVIKGNKEFFAFVAETGMSPAVQKKLESALSSLRAYTDRTGIEVQFDSRLVTPKVGEAIEYYRKNYGEAQAKAVEKMLAENGFSDPSSPLIYADLPKGSARQMLDEFYNKGIRRTLIRYVTKETAKGGEESEEMRIPDLPVGPAKPKGLFFKPKPVELPKLKPLDYKGETPSIQTNYYELNPFFGASLDISKRQPVAGVYWRLNYIASKDDKEEILVSAGPTYSEAGVGGSLDFQFQKSFFPGTITRVNMGAKGDKLNFSPEIKLGGGIKTNDWWLIDDCWLILDYGIAGGQAGPNKDMPFHRISLSLGMNPGFMKAFPLPPMSGEISALQDLLPLTLSKLTASIYVETDYEGNNSFGIKMEFLK